MAVTSQFYNSFIEDLGLARMNLVSDVFKVMLVYGYTFNAAHTSKSQITGEIPQQNGYSGPATLDNINWGWDVVHNFTRLDADDESWTAIGGVIGPMTGAVIYNDTTTSPTADRLVCYIDFGGEELISANSQFKLTFNVNGIFSITQNT